MEDNKQEKKILKVILIIFIILVIVIFGKFIFSKIMNAHLRSYLVKQGYTTEVRNNYNLVVNGLSFNDYVDSKEVIKNSEVYSYDIQNFLYSYNKRNSDSEKEVILNALYKIKDSQITAYYSEDYYGMDKSLYVNYSYDIVSGENACSVVVGDQSVKEEKCNMLKDQATSIKEKYDKLLKDSGAIKGLIK